MKKLKNNLLKKVAATRKLKAMMGVSLMLVAHSASAKSFVEGLSTMGTIVSAVGGLILLSAGVWGAYLVIVGGKGMFSREQGDQSTPGQNLGKLAGGMFLVMASWFITNAALEFTGAETNANQSVFSSNASSPVSGN